VESAYGREGKGRGMILPVLILGVKMKWVVMPVKEESTTVRALMTLLSRSSAAAGYSFLVLSFEVLE
jgi:hypothetical protein